MGYKLIRLSGFVLLFVGMGLFVVTFIQSGGEKSVPPIEVSAPQATPEPMLQPPPSASPIVSIQAPRINIDAPVINLGVDPDGTMQSPSTPTDVAWYRFSAYPGNPGNAVFAGHLDFIRYGAAVFYNLRQLQLGDEIMIRLADDTLYTYRVVSSRSFSSNDAPIEEIIGPTADEVVTLITCDGVFNTITRDYGQRLVVRAERVYAPATGVP